jgi:hypothetical protein
MINAIDEVLAKAREVAVEQSNRIVSELNAAYDAMNAAQTRFNDRMAAAKAKRAEADAIEADAIREHDTALSNAAAVSLSILQQLSEGRMITGSATPAPKRPRLVGAKQASGE